MKIVTLTEKAIKRSQEIQDTHPEIIGIKISIQKGGCAGMEYKIESCTFAPEDSIEEKFNTFSVFIVKDSLLYLLSSEIDYQSSSLKSGFIINNPNQVSSCGCGESVCLVPAEKS